MLSRVFALTSLTLMLFLIFPFPTGFAENETIEEKQVKIAENNVTFLKEQTKNITDAAQKNQESLISFINVLFVFVTVFVAVAALFTQLQVFRTRKDIKEKLEWQKKQMLLQYEEESKQQINEMIDKERVIIQEMINKQLAYQQASILVMGTTKQQLDTMKQRDLIPLYNKDVSPLDCLYDKKELQQQLKNSTFDLLIYTYHPIDGKDPNVITIAELFKQSNQNIPLIIYAPKERMVERDQAIEIYPWIGIANLPTTLVEQAFALVTTFGSQKKSS